MVFPISFRFSAAQGGGPSNPLVPPLPPSGEEPGSSSMQDKLAAHNTPVQFFSGPGVTPRSAEQAKSELAKAHAEHVMLVLSNGVGDAGEAAPATPLIPEAAALIDACKLLNKDVTVVAPEVTLSALTQFLKPNYPNFAEHGRFIAYDRQAGQAAPTVGKAREEFDPDFIVGIGVPADDRKAIKQAVTEAKGEQKHWLGTNGKVPEVPIIEVLGTLAESDDPVQLQLATLIAVDSGTGGIVGAKVSKAAIEARTPFRMQIIAEADIGKAPYGQYNDDTLPPIVKALLESAEEVLPRELVDEISSQIDEVPISVKCNTACTALPNARERVVNLIANTALTIVRDGGDRPAIVGTPVTARNSAYPLAVEAASNGRIRPKMIAAHEQLAAMYNDMDHLSEDSDTREAYRQIIRDVVTEVPQDATSLSLCCTHYPLGKEDFARELEAQGKGHVCVINPMSAHQTESIIKKLYKQRAAFPKAPDHDLPPIILTTGKMGATEVAARKIWGGDVIVVAGREFGAGKFDMQLVHPVVADQNPRFRPRRLPEDGLPGDLPAGDRAPPPDQQGPQLNA